MSFRMTERAGRAFPPFAASHSRDAVATAGGVLRDIKAELAGLLGAPMTTVE